MPSSFVTYIDESGDEGFVFKPDGSGSSRWFVLSAAIFRKFNDLQSVACLKEVRKLLGKPPKYPLHFVDLKHEQRKPYVRRIGELPLRTISVLIYKPLITDPEKFQNNKYLLYRYATRLLLERVSWLCRDHRRPGEGDGYTDIIFSNRSNMSYEEIRDYLRLLLERADANPENIQLESTVIDPERIETVEHSKRAGLQVADAVASSAYMAVARNRYGETEPSYLRLLGKTIYRHNNMALGYGLKVWPGDIASIKAKAPEGVNLEGF